MMSDFEKFGRICADWLEAAKGDTTSEEEDKGGGVVSHLRPVTKRPRINRGSPPKARRLLLVRSA
jgi:hypothetical protein